ncbi:putative coiled-coil domain-containing protein 195 [Onychostruthus taczanowskii]|uniref:putative coiled-coil domain-containing protein 195 n=1 Tax=Onychostruthus taczanowskii TaxID=356909 RepID=UPI001B80C975|nr:putative coiled-coil domain-containing protein 195 [Onychostruthus taczanowskii]
MEGNAHLLQLTRKMRSQINKLERENRALKGELRGCGHTALPAPGDASGGAGRREPAPGAEGPAASPASPTSPASPASLQGGAAAAPAPREQTGTAMTVRRYPTASPAPAPSSTRAHWAGRKSTGLPEVPGSAQPPAPPAAAQLSREEEEGLGKSPACCPSSSHSSNMKLFQEHVYECQGKVKAVSFLLPTDMSSFAEKQSSLKSPQNQSAKHLMTHH